MDLFTNTEHPYKEIYRGVIGEWVDLMDYDTIELLDQIIRKLKRLNNNYYPQVNPLIAYLTTPPNRVKVVILGQAPYHDGNATGFAFACAKSISPSLKEIKKALAYNLNTPQNDIILNKNLSLWTDQGVLLINTLLTAQPGQPLSHRELGWEEFTIKMLNIINKIDNNIGIMLWGNYAEQIYYKSKGIYNPKHKICISNHPMHAVYNNEVWDCQSFKYINEFFKYHNITEIKWFINKQTTKENIYAKEIEV